MMAVYFICLLPALGYALLMAAYRHGWAGQREFVPADGYEASTFISVIIPARNEEHNITACITAILAQKYPPHLLEVIVVDDHSEDGTAAVVKSFGAANLKYMHLRDYLGGRETIAYKKAAISAGIAESRGSLIVTTDADCIAPEAWLLNIAAIYERVHPVMVVAPVIFSCDNGLLQSFQLIDFMSMQGITGAALKLRLGNMCNGANLAFSKAAFEQAGGYDGADNMASGDDYLLMMKISRQAPGKIAYLKAAQAIVTTAPQPGWKGFIQQRIRWSSKSGKYNDTRLTGILILVYLFNLSFPVLAVAGIFHPAYLWLAVAILAVKILAEYVFLVPVARFFGRSRIPGYFFLLQPLHIAYVIIAGFLGFIGGYSWKGRSVR